MCDIAVGNWSVDDAVEILRAVKSRWVFFFCLAILLISVDS